MQAHRRGRGWVAHNHVARRMPFRIRVASVPRLIRVWLAAADCLFEEVTPAALLDDRPCENGTRDFLVQWSDGAEDSWVMAPR